MAKRDTVRPRDKDVDGKLWRGFAGSATLLLLALALFVRATLNAQSAQPSEGPLWQDVSAQSLGAPPPERRISGRYRALDLNTGRMTALLAATRRAVSGDSSPDVVVELPWPDGGVRSFRIQESPILSPQLASQFPQIRTFAGVGLEDRRATVRLDWTPRGFHALVLSTDGEVYIDPYSRTDTRHYVAYFRRDYRRQGAEPFSCLGSPNAPAQVLAPATIATGLSYGATLRTYRLAVAATGEYTAFQGGTVPDAMSAIVTTVNRVTGIYERDLAVRFVLVGGESSLIYVDPQTDPYTNGNGAAMLSENQANLDSTIGSTNYDVGQVFGTAGTSQAFLGAACAAGIKARGVTTSPAPVADAFDVDYVAHELGHQFNARHTFNGTTSNCAGNRDDFSAYEPGSGSTIMAYAGICGAENLQAHSDAMFHGGSQDQIIAFIEDSQSGGSCPVASATGNGLPIVDAGADYTIPQSTPFALTASASDPDSDPLTYAWEEFDLGTSSPPETDDGSRPLFRAFLPAASPVRTLPRIADIINNSPTFGESMATTSRAMTFRVTVRDNHANGGGTSSDEAVITVTAGSGPFVVTAPNTAALWTSGTTETITWDVANTAAAPVNTANVTISLSTDGGLTFPIVLAANTPNDGSQPVFVPNLPTTTGRVRVEAVGNVFFDISDADLTISSAAPPINFQNGGFDNGMSNWGLYATPDPSYIVSNVTNGVFEFYRSPPPPNTTNEAEIVQSTGQGVAAATPLLAQFDLGNSDNVRRRINVLIHDLNFSELTACSFFLPANAPMRTYAMRAHSTQAWQNVTISFYAMNAGSNGGRYRLDNVSVQIAPNVPTDRTDCLDPTAPTPPGGSAGPTLINNGDFSAGTANWLTDGGIVSQVSSGVYEFYSVSAAAPSVSYQPSGDAVTVGQILTATFQIGNSSAARKRVKVLLHDLDFSDLVACSFYIPAGQPLSDYAMRAFAGKNWTNVTISFYPLPVDTGPWVRLDNVVVQQTPAGPTVGTECLEPGGT